MFENLLQIEQNQITLDIVKFREIGQYAENQDELIQYIFETNLKVLETYPTFIYKFSLSTVSLLDLPHVLFINKLFIQAQEKFPSGIEAIYVEDVHELAKFGFSLFVSLIKPDNLSKIHFV